MKTITSLLFVLAACAQTASAQPGYEFTSGGTLGMESEAGRELRQEDAADAAPQPQIEGEVTWLCGGIGEQEAAHMKQQAQGYDLMLSFATRDGAYLADVDVELRNAKGEAVLQAHCDAPIMLVDLPASGRYRVRASAEGVNIDKTVHLDARQGPQVAAIVMSWPQQLAGPGSAAATSGDGSAAGDAR